MSHWDKWQPLVDMMKERQNKWKENLENWMVVDWLNRYMIVMLIEEDDC